MYIVKLAIADLADYYASGKASPDLILAGDLWRDPVRVRDVTAADDGYEIHTVTCEGVRDSQWWDEQDSEWFVTTDKAVSELG